MKGVSQVVMAVLLVLIGISLTASYISFAGGSLFSVTNATEQRVEQDILKSKACLKILSLDLKTNSVKLWNCGSLALTDLAVYIDDIPASADLPKRLNVGEIAVATITSPISLGTHTFKISSAQAVAYASR